MKHFLLFSFLFYSNTVFSQEKGNFRFGIYGHALNFRASVLPQYGLTGEYFLDHRFSLNYRYGVGYNTEGGVTGHINPSILGIIFAPTAESLALAAIIPEGFSYHFYPKEKFEIAPYLNPLGSEINIYSKPMLVLSGSAGINLHFRPVHDFSFAPNMGIILIYRNGEIIPNLGFSLNYLFHK